MIEIPKFLSHLRTYRGHPVPFTQLWANGALDFRAVDMERWAQCLKEKLCGICGKRLGEFCYFIGGPKGGQSEVLRPVWAKALEALREAGRIFIIGYSMPDTDQFFRYMLTLALSANEMLDRVIVVNTSPEAHRIFGDLFHPLFVTKGKLKAVESQIEDYAMSGALLDSLVSELGQFQEGLDQSMIESSGFRFQS